MKTRVPLMVAALLWFVGGCSGAGSDDDTTTPGITPEVTAEATSAPSPTARPETTPDATGAPTTTPEPMPTATPEPMPTATPEPMPTATPEPMPTATPEPTAIPTPTPPPVALLDWDLTLVDYVSQEPLSGVKVTLGSEVKSTDVDGQVTFQVEPDSVGEVKAELKGYIATYWVLSFDDFGWSTTYAMLSNATIKALGVLLGVPYDSSRAILEVDLITKSEEGSYSFGVSGATVDLDVSYDAALVSDSSSSNGFSAGNTTLPGSASQVYFVNVKPGTVNIRIDPSDNFSCGSDPAVLQTHAGAFTDITLICDPL